MSKPYAISESSCTLSPMASLQGKAADALAVGIERVLQCLGPFREQHRLKVAYRTGKLVVDTLYGGDAQAWRQRPAGDSLYPRLERHPALPITPAELYRSLRVFDICEQNPTLLESESLSLSHVLAVLSLDSASQGRLLKLAEAEKWTVRKVREMVEREYAVLPSTGRPRTSPILRTLTRELASEHAFEGTDSLLALDRRTATKLLSICGRAQRELNRVERTLKYVASEQQRIRLLVVDGNETFAFRAQRQLRHHARVIRVAHSCTEALAQVDAQTVCAVIELFLPDGCGLELSRALVRRHPGLRCIFLTARQRAALPVRFQGVEPLVVKTSGLHPLRAAIAKVLAPQGHATDVG